MNACHRGPIVFLLAGLVAIVAVTSNAWAGHPPTEKFAVLGGHPTGSTGTLFLLRIVVGAVALLGLTGLFSVGAGVHEPATPFAAPRSDHQMG